MHTIHCFFALGGKKRVFNLSSFSLFVWISLVTYLFIYEILVTRGPLRFRGWPGRLWARSGLSPWVGCLSFPGWLPHPAFPEAGVSGASTTHPRPPPGLKGLWMSTNLWNSYLQNRLHVESLQHCGNCMCVVLVILLKDLSLPLLIF